MLALCLILSVTYVQNYAGISAGPYSGYNAADEAAGIGHTKLIIRFMLQAF